MRIALNVLYWIPNAMGGSQTYQRRLMEGLATVDDENEYIVLLNHDGAQHFQPSSPRFRAHVCPLPGQQRLQRVLWEQIVLPSRLHSLGIDVLHSLGYLAPRAASGANVVTVLDMIHYVYPRDIELPKRLAWRVLFPLSLRRADRVIVFSESVRGELAHFFPWAAGKVSVIPLGVDPLRFSPGPAEPCAAARGKPFLLSVSGASPHKNLARLVQAFARVRRKFPERDLQLVLAGLMQAEQSALVQRTAKALGVNNHVTLTGRVPHEELVQLYRSAEMLVYPSLYEGFGLPPLEAMSCGCPVVASNQTAIPEVTGDAALLFHPKDVEGMAACIGEVLASPTRRRALAEGGLERARQYRWPLTAERTLAVYRACVGQRGLDAGHGEGPSWSAS